MRLSKAANAGRAPLHERALDLYETPPVAVEALLRAERLPRVVWDPACGPGAIVRVLRGHRIAVVATDLVDYGCPQGAGGFDFLKIRRAPPDCRCIVTNPPYKDATAFVRRALELVPRVVMLLRLAFLESERRSDVLDGGRLRRVHVFAKRLPFMHRAGWTGPKAVSAIAFAWFVWDEKKGPTTIDRIKF
jgi:hypothetical protein